ncbi:type II toxin-antitoxin system death-on-curing family toxin [Breoghania sp. JC706]|uniref:type II toxin-antitoxin system death-on-curing family toxin n=1 Tax=Breoghania sp. JC706 TaxID=3117732 RepID=UPI0030090C0B
MTTPIWLTFEEIQELSEVVGSHFPEHPVLLPSAREDALASALSRAPNRFFYDQQTDILVFAALYIQSIAKAHAFLDGNKRIAFLAATLFLHRYGIRLNEPLPGFFAAIVISLVKDEISVEAAAEMLQTYAEFE